MEAGEVQTDLVGEQTVGVELRIGETRVYYIPGCAMLTEGLATRLAGADAVFFDGTLWRDDEMRRAGLGEKTGKRMGHMSMSGADGTIAAFAGLTIGQKVFVHMNNTNPVLRPGSIERDGSLGRMEWRSRHDPVERGVRGTAAADRGGAVSRPAPVSRDVAWRRLQPRSGARLGDQPVLLSAFDPDEGRGLHEPGRGSRSAAHLALADRGS
jgi:hypothetical protein